MKRCDLVVLSVALLTGCGRGEVDLTVELVTTYRPGLDAHAIEVTVLPTPSGNARVVRIPLREGDAYATPQTVAVFAGLPEGTHVLTLSLRDRDGGVIVSEERVLDLGADAVERFELARSCDIVTCPGTGDPDDATICVPETGACARPACDPAAPLPCYDGPMGTADVGACRTGTVECVGTDYGGCTGTVLPEEETAVDVDDDCDGIVDESVALAATEVSVAAADIGFVVAWTGRRDEEPASPFVYTALLDESGAVLRGPRAAAAGDRPSVASFDGQTVLSYREWSAEGGSGPLVAVTVGESGAAADRTVLADDEACALSELSLLADGTVARGIVVEAGREPVLLRSRGGEVERTSGAERAECDVRLAGDVAGGRAAMVWLPEGSKDVRLMAAGASGVQAPLTVITLVDVPDDFAVTTTPTRDWLVVIPTGTGAGFRRLVVDGSGVVSEVPPPGILPNIEEPSRVYDVVVFPNGLAVAMIGDAVRTRLIVVPFDAPAGGPPTRETVLGWKAARGRLVAGAQVGVAVFDVLPGVEPAVGYVAPFDVSSLGHRTREVWQ